MDNSLYFRLVQPYLEEALDDTPVVLIHGSRQCGKTTLAQTVGGKRGYEYFTFDDANLVAAATIDPISFIERLPEKVILDEIQHVPELFASIKKSVDENRKPGRFLLTGSSNVLLLPKLSDSLAGRMEILELRPLSRCEIEGSGQGLLPAMLQGIIVPASAERLKDNLATYIIAGGFPEALGRSSERRRQKWYRNYIETLVQRDIRDLTKLSHLETMPQILKLAAIQSAQLLNMSGIAAPFQVSRPTIKSYFTLLQHVFLVDVLPAWHSNKLKRLIKTPKVHLTDTGLASQLLSLNANKLESDRKVLGQLLESFVYNELRRQASWLDEDIHFYHFRDKDQYEVDIVLEQSGGQLVGVEVKAAATVNVQDFKGLKRLRTVTQEKFTLGIVFYDGDMVLSFGDRLLAVPISQLWRTT